MNLGRSTADAPDAIAGNRARLLAAIAADPARLVTAGQVHGARAVVVDRPGHVPDCDALVSRTPGLVLAITTADCMSILISAPGAAAAIHAGWRGLAAGVLEAAIAALRGLTGAPSGRMEVHFGPCIRGCCYEVGDEVAGCFPASACSHPGTRPHLDLPTAARERLAALGCGADAVEDTGACTACEPSLYFSHRRDHGVTGRHWAIAIPGTGRDASRATRGGRV
jgi:hypothetical protein